MIPSFKTLDQIVYLLGEYTISNNEGKAHKFIVEQLSNDLDKSENTCKANLGRLKSTTPPLIEKYKDDGTVFYKFTVAGYNKYLELKDQETTILDSEAGLKGDHKYFNDWFGIYYPNSIDQFQDAVDQGRSCFEIDYETLIHFKEDWEHCLISEPERVLKAIRENVYNYLEPHFIDDFKELLDKLEIHIVNIPEQFLTQVEDIDTSKIGQFVAIEGRVTEQSKIEAKAKNVCFKCVRCETETRQPQPFTGKFEEPAFCISDSCPGDKTKKPTFKILGDKTEWVNGQSIVLSSLRQSNRIKTIRCLLEGDICKFADERDGKKVVVTGTLLHIQKLDKTRSKTVNFDFAVKVNNIYLASDSLASFPSDSEIDMFEEWAEDKKENCLSTVHGKIVDSVAPSVYGMEFEKNAASLSLFSDWTWNMTNQALERSSIHTLLLGDSGTAKSKIMKGILEVSPRGLNEYTYKSAIQSTAVGLTSVVDKSDIDGKWTLRAGFLASADQGVVGIDEIDKMNQSDLGTIAPVLEDQKQDVAKAAAGSFYSRCAVIMTANPDKGKVDRNIPIIDQFSTAVFFKQRIDLIIGVPDIPEEEWDSNVSDRILQNHQRTLELCNHANTNIKDVHGKDRAISIDHLRKYVLYARSKPAPIMTARAMKDLKAMYIEKRKFYPESVAPRLLSSLIRISTAIARRELSSTVEFYHAAEAMYLMELSLRSVLGSDDPWENYSVIEFGQSKGRINKMQLIQGILKQTSEYSDIIEEAAILNIDRNTVDDIIGKWKTRGEVQQSGSKIRLVGA